MFWRFKVAPCDLRLVFMLTNKPIKMAAVDKLLEKCLENLDTTLFLNYMNLAEIPHGILQLHMLERLYMKQNLLNAVVCKFFLILSVLP